MNICPARTPRRAARAAAIACLLTLSALPAQTAWEPTRPMAFVVPAGSGGGADRMARFIQGGVAMHRPSTPPTIAVNNPGGSGAERFRKAAQARAAAFTSPLPAALLAMLLAMLLATQAGLSFKGRSARTGFRAVWRTRGDIVKHGKTFLRSTAVGCWKFQCLIVVLTTVSGWAATRCLRFAVIGPLVSGIAGLAFLLLLPAPAWSALKRRARQRGYGVAVKDGA